jgi:hypothetical protein
MRRELRVGQGAVAHAGPGYQAGLRKSPFHTSVIGIRASSPWLLHSKRLRTPRLITAGCWLDGVAADAAPYLLDEPVQVEW